SIPSRSSQPIKPERRIGFIGWDDREGILLLDPGLLVSDQAIHPEICHRDFQRVLAGYDRLADVEYKRRVPDRSDMLAVQGDIGKFVHLTQIELKLACFGCSGGKLEAFGVGPGAGE